MLLSVMVFPIDVVLGFFLQNYKFPKKSKIPRFYYLETILGKTFLAIFFEITGSSFAKTETYEKSIYNIL